MKLPREKSSDKTKEISELYEIVAKFKSLGKKIVHCHGVFDLLHLGHIEHIEKALTYGDLLIVTVTSDRFVNKGPGRPAFSHELRTKALAALQCVDYVAVNDAPDAIDLIKKLRPNVYVKGSEYKDESQDLTGKIRLESEAVKSVGGMIKFTGGITFSSSSLINRYLPILSPEIKERLGDLKKRYPAGQILEFLESLRSLKVMVVGEAILDEYVYCAALGKSSKDPVLAMQYLSRQIQAGGSLVIANHLADFCQEVMVVSYLGESGSRENFIRSCLKSNVNPRFIYKSKSPTIVKRRYVEQYSVSKMLEIYEMNDSSLNKQENESLCAILESNIPRYDIVIAADFGHGMIDSAIVDLLISQSQFLAVNTQINAANKGFHTVSKYSKASYICVHEGEIRLDQRSRHDNLEVLIKDLSMRLGCKMVMVTQGKEGTLLYREGEGFICFPSLAGNVVDRLGAGDAVLAVSSLCARKGLPGDVLSLIANVVGAQAVKVLGNSDSINRVQVIKAIESLLR